MEPSNEGPISRMHLREIGPSLEGSIIKMSSLLF